MEIKQVEYFLKVVECGGFLAASMDLYISQSSLSKQIMALEKELDFALFDRSKRKIVLTPAGECFLPYARSLVAVYQQTMEDVARFKNTSALKIVAIPVIAQYGIPALLAQFKQIHPKIELTLTEHEASALLPLLNNRQADLVLLRDNYLDKEQYHWIPITQDHFVVILSTQHPLSARTSLNLVELADENFIMFDKGTVVHELALEACQKVGFDPRIFYASLRVESVLGLVASNSGVALIMKKVFEHHQHPDVVAIDPVESTSSNLVLAWRKDRKLSRSMIDFINFIKTNCEKAI